jgi:hypothetical protein
MFANAIAMTNFHNAVMIDERAVAMCALESSHIIRGIELGTNHFDEIRELNNEHSRVIRNLKTEHGAQIYNIEFVAAGKLIECNKDLDMQVGENFLMQKRIHYLECVAEAREKEMNAMRDRNGVLEAHVHGMQVFGQF